MPGAWSRPTGNIGPVAHLAGMYSHEPFALFINTTTIYQHRFHLYLYTPPQIDAKWNETIIFWWGNHGGIPFHLEWVEIGLELGPVLGPKWPNGPEVGLESFMKHSVLPQANSGTFHLERNGIDNYGFISLFREYNQI